MRPRPRSRGKPIEYVPPEVLLFEVREARREHGEPAAIVVGKREWDLIRVQPEAAPHVSGLIDEELCFDGVPVIVAPRKARPQVVVTMDDLVEALAG